MPRVSAQLRFRLRFHIDTADAHFSEIRRPGSMPWIESVCFRPRLEGQTISGVDAEINYSDDRIQLRPLGRALFGSVLTDDNHLVLDPVEDAFRELRALLRRVAAARAWIAT